MSDLWSEITDRFALLDTALAEVGRRGADYASAEASYRTALAAEELRLRADEKMPVTLVPDVARGDREVALRKVKRDCAEASYKAAVEAVNVYKLQVRVLEAQYEREWGRIER